MADEVAGPLGAVPRHDAPSPFAGAARVGADGVRAGSPAREDDEAARLELPRDDARITALVREHHPFVWRLLRRLGVPEPSVDDATQQVFCIAARRIDDIARGSERAFLFGSALRVASDDRRLASRRERPSDELDERMDTAPNPEDLVDRRRARRLLDEILTSMPIELRTVLVLFELEQLTKNEVAELLGVPVGTAVSRLRRAREDFKARLQRRLAQRNLTTRSP